MADKKIVLVLNATQEYMKHSGEDIKKYAPELNRFFESISDTYIPLLNMFERLEQDKVPFNVALVLPPVLCTLLDDAAVQEQFLEWIDKRIEVGKKELERCVVDTVLQENAKNCFDKVQNVKDSFLKYNKRLVKKFHEYQKKGFVEILATCGTDIFLPHYNEMYEIMNAQVETGYFAYKSFFGDAPEGFWLPDLGYYPGIEKIIKKYNINYTVLDTKSFLFSEEEPVNGIFTPARFQNSLVAFGRESSSDEQIFGEEGYASNEIYLAANRDIGFEFEQDYFSPFIEPGKPRYPFGYKYWTKKSYYDDDSSNSPEYLYDIEKVRVQLKNDADDFIKSKVDVLNKAEECLENCNELSLTVSINLNKLRSEWVEGIKWIENLFRSNLLSDVSFELPKKLLSNQFNLQKIQPYYGSSSGVGYGENLLSSKNNWMMRYVIKASERMVDLASRFPSDTGLKARLLNLGAKELMMAQSSGWAKMIHDGEFPEYAEIRFKQSINDFTAVFDALGSNTVSTEWLTKLENEHQIFSWMNYRIFSKKSV